MTLNDNINTSDDKIEGQHNIPIQSYDDDDADDDSADDDGEILSSTWEDKSNKQIYDDDNQIPFSTWKDKSNKQIYNFVENESVCSQDSQESLSSTQINTPSISEHELLYNDELVEEEPFNDVSIPAKVSSIEHKIKIETNNFCAHRKAIKNLLYFKNHFQQVISSYHSHNYDQE